MDEYINSIIQTGQTLEASGLITGAEGNISIRLSKDRILITPSGADKGSLTSQELLEVSLEGELIRGAGRPSSELPMHLAIYQQDREINGIVHAHPPIATAFACVDRPLDVALIPEAVVALGVVPNAAYATPSTDGVAEGAAELVAQHDAFLLANHGAVTTGTDLELALERMLVLEKYAAIYRYSLQLGKPNYMTEHQLQELIATVAEHGNLNKALRNGHLPRSAEQMAGE